LTVLGTKDSGRIARREWLWAVMAMMSMPTHAIAQACKPQSPKNWPMWEQFKQRFIQADGRVIDPGRQPGQTTSEGQSYSMFFALVHKDQAMFKLLWQWSETNLAQGDMKARLAAWLWGYKADGSWGVVDSNSATDADCWFAYALLEAGRLWNVKSYTESAQALLDRIIKEAIVDLPDLGKMLLPGPQGFVKNDNGVKLWRLNPSYLPLMLFRRFAVEQPNGPWTELVHNTVLVLTRMSTKSVVPDWVAYTKTEQGIGRFVPDPDSPQAGSYDAIRTYMWAGMVDRLDDFRGTILRRVSGMVDAANSLDGMPPEFIDISTGQAKPGRGPVGFSAALLPYFKSSGQYYLLYRLAVKRVSEEFGNPAASASLPYYDYVLALFGTGWDEDRYGFTSAGHLKPSWEPACPSKSER
jgi:endo-1,4-beta-D-glucanase Y